MKVMSYFTEDTNKYLSYNKINPQQKNNQKPFHLIINECIKQKAISYRQSQNLSVVNLVLINPMQLVNPDESISDKISSSIKKSHKISIYSKKSTKSPKKNQPQVASRVQETRDFHAVLMMAGDRFTQGNSINGLKLNNNGQHYLGSANTNEHNAGSHKNMNLIDLSKHNTKSIPTRQQSYQQQRQQSNFFQTPAPPVMIKKANTLNDNTFITGTNPTSNYHMNNNNRTLYTNGNAKNNMQSYPSQEMSVHNISQMIDKQAESETNNLSVLEGSFLTGVRNTSFSNVFNNNHTNNHMNNLRNNLTNNLTNNLPKAKDSQNSQLSQQQKMDNFMKFMHEQIYIAKEKCEKRVNEILKDNVKVIAELKDKLVKNELLLREKIVVIERIKQAVRKGNDANNSSNGNGKKAHSQGQIAIRKEYSPQQAHKLHNGNPNSYHETRIADLQAKLAVLQSIIGKKYQNKQQLDIKIQILQRHLIVLNHSKLKHLSLKLSAFISSTNQKTHWLSQQYQKLKSTLQKHRQQSIGFNQNQIKQQKFRLGQIQKQLQDFMGKQFKYENYHIDEVKGDMEKLKEQLRKFESMHYQNSKIVKQLISTNNNHPQTQKPCLSPLQTHSNKQQPSISPLQNPSNNQQPQPIKKLTTLSNINQTLSKYTATNMSKISISELSNTNEYSHMIQKVSPNQKYFTGNNYYNSHNTSNSESLISMNFTEEASESMTPRIKGAESIKYHQDKLSNIAMSKYTKNTDLKQTSSQLQTTPPSASKYYLPTTKTSISIHSIMAPNQSSTQQKILHLNELKMQTIPSMHSVKQTPQKFVQIQQQQNSSKKSIYYQNLSQLQKSLDQNNTSYLSIGQMEDFNVSRRDVNNETSDFSDDEFFYYQAQGRQANDWQSPQKSYKTTERFLQTEEFSPMKKKLTSTEQHFYQSTKSPQTVEQSRDKPMFMYNSSLDYEKFSDDEDDDHREQVKNDSQKMIAGNFTNERIHSNHNPSSQNQNRNPNNTAYKVPLHSPQLHAKPQNFTLNQQRLINSLKWLKKHQLPVKMIYDRKKNQGVMRMLDIAHQLNGKSWPLNQREVEKLEGLGYVQVKTYV